jgi:hypothetical protein
MTDFEKLRTTDFQRNLPHPDILPKSGLVTTSHFVSLTFFIPFLDRV